MSELNFLHSNGNKVKLTTPDTLAANKTFKLPGADGTSGQALVTNGSGALSFASMPVQPARMADTWRLVTQYINAQTTLGSGGSDWERDDTYGNGLLGTGAASAGMSVSNGYFSFPTTGIYSVRFYGHHSASYANKRCH